MREILFRGKKPVEYYNMIDNSGGKWVEGYLIALHDGQSPAIQSEIKIVPVILITVVLARLSRTHLNHIYALKM